ncbi:hypothetical protein [Ectothiorhodospira sp. PHS-1]|uniref:hypothetical protein n=1 Tax=Ectothiorhodospira sp. PHS-1 TaxID=519989 RepID=UPI001FF011D4|nr:hypothetical protein [Ectothiorhodospira sp. PHS-1]
MTGKIDYLIDLVRFIRDEENLPINDQASSSQQSLLSTTPAFRTGFLAQTDEQR